MSKREKFTGNKKINSQEDMSKLNFKAVSRLFRKLTAVIVFLVLPFLNFLFPFPKSRRDYRFCDSDCSKEWFKDLQLFVEGLLLFSVAQFGYWYFLIWILNEYLP